MRRILLALAVTVASASCAHTVIGDPIKRQDDHWDLTLNKLTDGPNSFGEGGGIVYHPAAGERFVWAHITLHNAAPTPRKFSFDRCSLDAGDLLVLPAMVSFAILNGGINREPEIAANETIDRRLIFSYPEHQSPTRFLCEPMAIPVPQF
jgi:hypothetical protein